MIIQVQNANQASLVRFTIDGTTVRECLPSEAVALAGEVYRAHGKVPEFAYFRDTADDATIMGAPAMLADDVQDDEPAPNTERTPAPRPAPSASTLPVSTFGEGGQIVDPHALDRIEAQHAALASAGIVVNASEQLYATGTRMADVGYTTQQARHMAFLEMRPAADAVNELVQVIQAEKREDMRVTTHDLARNIGSNGAVRAYGLTLSATAVRGLFASIGDTSAASYVLGVGERIQGTTCDALIHSDAAKAADVLAYELTRAPNKTLVLRTRQDGPKDVYACVSIGYVAADAPTLAPSILRRLPAGTRASFDYDPDSTAWTMRLDVWTPTPVAEQAVGEAFNGYVGLGSADNGTRAFRGDGGVTMLRCLNASTYLAAGRNVRRIHRGRILHDIGAMIREARASIDALVHAWGVARTAVVEIPDPLVGRPLSEVMPGLWRSLLTDRSSELVSVLPGRTETHVKALSAVYDSERRDPSRLVRADFGQTWTRYAQSFPAPVQREAESAIGAWTVSGRPIAYSAR